jgi:hypothetical protein
MAVSKAGQKSDWKDGFLFLGNHLALDFLNTCPVQNGEGVELLPDFDALLRWFQAADLLSSREAASLRQLWGESARAVPPCSLARTSFLSLSRSSHTASTTCLWRTVQPRCSLTRIATVSANVDSACCTSMTQARKGPGAGAACNFVETGSRLLPTQLAGARSIATNSEQTSLRAGADRTTTPLLTRCHSPSAW